MLKSRIQGFVAGLLAAILLVATFALASPAIREVFYGVNVVVNGEPQEFDDDMQPFISDGRTFLPVRGIAEVLGIDVNWDGETQTVYIGEMPELPPIATPNIGEIIEFGGIQWRVLDLEDGKALLLSEYLLEQMSYHNSQARVTWETSDIRYWLNNDFYNRFTVGERARIAETTVGKIFLLSIEEVEQYWGENDARRAYLENGEPWPWWLRSTSYDTFRAMFIWYHGGIGYIMVTDTYMAIRPAMWVYL